MKKYWILSAVLLGTAVTSQAGGIDFHIGIPLPPLPGIVFGFPAPRVFVAPPVCAPGPPVVYVPAPHCYVPPPVVCAPPPVVYGRPYAYYYSHGHAHDWRNEREAHHRDNERHERH